MHNGSWTAGHLSPLPKRNRVFLGVTRGISALSAFGGLERKIHGVLPEGFRRCLTWSGGLGACTSKGMRFGLSGTEKLVPCQLLSRKLLDFLG